MQGAAQHSFILWITLADFAEWLTLLIIALDALQILLLLIGPDIYSKVAGGAGNQDSSIRIEPALSMSHAGNTLQRNGRKIQKPILLPLRQAQALGHTGR